VTYMFILKCALKLVEEINLLILFKIFPVLAKSLRIFKIKDLKSNKSEILMQNYIIVQSFSFVIT